MELATSRIFGALGMKRFKMMQSFIEMKEIKKKISRESDLYFSDPEVIASIIQGIEEER